MSKPLSLNSYPLSIKSTPLQELPSSKSPSDPIPESDTVPVAQATPDDEQKKEMRATFPDNMQAAS